MRRVLETLWQDVGFGSRLLARSPAFAITAILTLALATGATTAIFSVVNRVLLRPLPFAQPAQLVEVKEIWRVGGAGPVMSVDLEEFRRQGASFEGFATYSLTTRNLDGAAGLERLTAVTVDRDFFRVLGVEPIAGRMPLPSDRGQLVVLSQRVWRELFSGDESIIGRPVPLTGQRFDQTLGRSVVERVPFTVLGVMPERFQFPYNAASVVAGALPETRTDIWMLDERFPTVGRFAVVGRIKPDVELAAAATELTLIKQRVDAQSTNPYRSTGVQIERLADVVLRPIARSLWILAAAVGLVIVAASANIANLLLSRTASRMPEVATRLALGAGRSRLVRQFLTESLLLALCGGVIGTLVAWWAVDLIVTLGAARIPRAHEVSLDWSAFAFLFGLCLLTAIAFGVAPALAASRADMSMVSAPMSTRTTEGRGLARLRDALVVAEVALAFVLALGAAAVMAEMSRLLETPSGMRPAGVYTMHLTPRATDEEYYRMEARVAAVPGVSAAGLAQVVPLQNWGWIGTFRIVDRPPADALPTAELRTVTAGYFEALGVPLLAGRLLTARDVEKPRGILINDALARRHFPDGDAVGRVLDRGTIVGVVADVRQVGLDQPAVPEIYQAIGPEAGIAPELGMSLIVRLARDAETTLTAVRAAVREVNPTLAVFNVKPMEQVVRDSLWELHLYRWLIGWFSALALLLAAIGLYGVTSYSVTARTRDYAVRLALGSSPRILARQVVAGGLVRSLIGLAAGGAIALLLGRVVQGLPAPGSGTIAAVALLLTAIALAACLQPAHRVSRVDPAVSLRQQ